MAGGTPCPNKPTCPMFPVFTNVSTLRIWMDNYCDADFSKCARYQKMSRGEDVPRTLMPNGHILTGKK